MNNHTPADAGLVAAAPELLEALRGLLVAQYGPDNLALLAAGYGVIPPEVQDRLTAWRDASRRAEAVLAALGEGTTRP